MLINYFILILLIAKNGQSINLYYWVVVILSNNLYNKYKYKLGNILKSCI